jgi:hypothetical protein
MPLDLPSPTAFTPLSPALFEPAGRRGGISTLLEDLPPVPRPRPIRKRMVTQEGAFQSQATEVSTETLDPVSQYIVKEAVRLFKQQLVKAQLENRLRELRVDAVRNSEPFSEASLADLRTFLDPLPLVERPAIFLLDNGNLRVLWKNAANEQVGLQFLGGGAVQFVIFVQRQNPAMTSRVAGIDALSALRARIKDSAYDQLIFG